MKIEDITKEQLISELAIIRQRNVELEKDITELKKIQAGLKRLDRLNLVGEMAAVISHEIRNSITFVRGFLQMAELRYSADKENLSLMIEELDRANAIITEFLSLTRNRASELKPVNLNFIINKILPLIQASAVARENNIMVVTEDIPDLLLDEKEIRQLLLNLIRNGLESMSPGGNVTIRTYNENENVVLSIQDQGNGIHSEIIDKLGTPFVTTKEHGTGLGLTVCYDIATRHNAQIDIDTGLTGTTFFIRFSQSVQGSA